MPKLLTATISFHSNDDGKDFDTNLTVTVKDKNQIACASISSDFGPFGAHTNNGPFNLDVAQQSQQSDLLSGEVIIHIEPNGHDTWDFNYFLMLTFDDGSKLTSVNNGLSLNQNQKQTQFGFGGLIQPVSPHHQNPVLKNCSIVFHSNSDGKDFDTHLTIIVTDSNQAIAAYIDNDFGAFGSNTDTSSINLPIISQSTKTALETGNVAIRIDPNGHDTWDFNFTLTLSFSDDSILTAQADDITLNQSARSQDFGVQGLVHAKAPLHKKLVV